MRDKMSNHSGASYLPKGRGRGRGRGRQQNPTVQSHENSWFGQGSKCREDQVTSEQMQAKTKRPKGTAEERFRQASAQIHQAVQKHIQDDMDANSSSSEDEIDNSEILQSTFKMYAGRTDDSVDDLDKTTQYLVDACESGANVCLVCIGKIKRIDAIWSCDMCYCILHLSCVQKWAHEGALRNAMLTDDDPVANQCKLWSCPKCRHEWPSSDIPKRSTCYCSKVIDPPLHPWLTPHSCGETCGKPLLPQCGHKCLLLCHPGPCPPCPKMVRSGCHCGRQVPQQRRCSSKTWSCGQTCGKRLSCGQHLCQQACHAGSCDLCPRTSSQKCLCGRQIAIRQCASPEWQCDLVCGGLLSCGHHTCQKICHSGQCGDCPQAGQRKCPCGKTSFQLPCTENIPTCGDTCDKLLECGLHKCTRRCHAGPCETCRQLSVKKCRCGQREKSIQCCKEYLCDYKCQNMRDCQRHQCKRKCCDRSCLPCEQPCGRQLPCKNHKCPSKCHPGMCYPCQETVDIQCFCESTIINVPCGRERSTKPPKCKKPCKIPPDCHHAVRDPHRCHFQRCPPCQQMCNKQLPNCNHRCPQKCHSAVLINQIENKVARMAPWDPLPQIQPTIINKPCPPCQVPIATECWGKHEKQNLPCASAFPFSCKRQCGRLLACTNHYCSLECHRVTGAENQTEFGKGCATCEEGCSKPRPVGCTHSCPINPCHPGPCPQCKRSRKQRCHCKMMLLHIECYKWTSASASEKAELSSCKGPCTKELSCSHVCSKSCHQGDCSEAKECTHKVSIKCDCKRRKKNFPCKDVKKDNVKVECDKSCIEAIKKQDKKKEDEKLQKEKEDKEKEQRDLEEYERLTKGKKRRERRRRENTIQPNFYQNNQKLITFSVSVLLISVALGYFWVFT